VLGKIPTINFDQFITLLATVPGRFKNPHWGTFFKPCEPCTIPYDHVVKMETFRQDVGIVLDRLKDPDKNTTITVPENGIHRSTVTKDRFAELAQAFHGIKPDLIDKLWRNYRWDFEVFGYTWNNSTGPGCVHYDDTGQCY
jgi:hypothetical protein